MFGGKLVNTPSSGYHNFPQDINKMLGEAGLSVEIVGVTAIAGLLCSEALKDEKAGNDVIADEAFEFFDVDGNGVIERGDIE